MMLQSHTHLHNSTVPCIKILIFTPPHTHPLFVHSQDPSHRYRHQNEPVYLNILVGIQNQFKDNACVLHNGVFFEDNDDDGMIWVVLGASNAQQWLLSPYRCIKVVEEPGLEHTSPRKNHQPSMGHQHPSHYKIKKI